MKSPISTQQSSALPIFAPCLHMPPAVTRKSRIAETESPYQVRRLDLLPHLIPAQWEVPYMPSGGLLEHPKPGKVHGTCVSNHMTWSARDLVLRLKGNSRMVLPCWQAGLKPFWNRTYLLLKEAARRAPGDIMHPMFGNSKEGSPIVARTVGGPLRELGDENTMAL